VCTLVSDLFATVYDCVDCQKEAMRSMVSWGRKTGSLCTMVIVAPTIVRPHPRGQEFRWCLPASHCSYKLPISTGENLDWDEDCEGADCRR